MSDKFYVPHDPDAERGLIAAIISTEGAILDEHADALTPETFWLPIPRYVFAACVELRNEHAPIDLLTVTAKLRATDMLEKAGGAGGVTELSYGGMAHHAGHYVARLQGQLALRRAQALASWAQGQIGPATNVSEYLAELQRRAAELEPAADTANQHELPSVIADVRKTLDDMDAGRKEQGIRTPLKAWDDAFGGIMDGQYYGLGGRPGFGKTALLEQMVFQCLMDGLPVAVFEKDMSPKMLIERMACREAKVPYWRYTRRLTNFTERAAIRRIVDALAESPLRLHNPHGLTADKLCAIVRREKRLHGIQAVFLDHIQLLATGKADVLREELTQASIALSRATVETNIPHVVLFHINRNGAKGRPSAEDVKEFDQLFGDVDGMAILWSEVKKEDLKRGQPLPTKFFVAKNRNGAVTEADIEFDGELMKFSDTKSEDRATQEVWEKV